MSFIDNLKTRVTPILFNRLDGKMHKTALPIAISATQKVRESGRVRARQRTAYSPQSISQPDAIAVETLKSALDSWITQGKLRRMSQATLTNRTFVIDKLLWHLERHQRKMCDRKALEDFLSYAGSPIPSNVARWGNTSASARATTQTRPETVATYHRVLRTAFRWLVEEEYLRESPLERIKPPIARADQIVPLTPSQIDLLLHATTQSEYPLRNRAIILLLLDTGLRAAELCSIRYGDLDIDSRRIVVLGKGNKRRTVFFGKNTTQALNRYLNIDTHADNDPLFFSERGTTSGGALTRSGLTQLIVRLGKAAGVRGVRCSPHTLRHTFALNFIQSGGNAFALKEFLGHTSLTISQRYVNLAGADMEGQCRNILPVDALLSDRSRRR